jgi:hypothetical protein
VINLYRLNINSYFRVRRSRRIIFLTSLTRVVDLDVLVSTGAGVAEDGRVHGHMAGGAALTAGTDDAQSARAHAVHAPVGVAVQVADGDGEASIVGADDVEMEAGPAGDV